MIEIIDTDLNKVKYVLITYRSGLNVALASAIEIMKKNNLEAIDTKSWYDDRSDLHFLEFRCRLKEEDIDAER